MAFRQPQVTAEAANNRRLELQLRCSFEVSNISENVPQIVPQLCANQAPHARYAAHARTFFLSDFLSVENKERCIYLPKLAVVGSSPIARSIFARRNRKVELRESLKSRFVPTDVPQIVLVWRRQ